MVTINQKILIINNYEIEGVLNELEAHRVEALLRSMKGVITAKISCEFSNLELVSKEKIETHLINDRLTLIGEYHLVNYFILNGVTTYL